jgi:hypothetical protein
MKTYLKPTDPRAFVDHDRMPADEAAQSGLTVECPQCKGHGGWNLELNAYPLHGKADTPRNRHLFSHFRASCSNCWGWGYVRQEEDHVHEWNRTRNVGNCQNIWECEVCGKEITVDSSG